MNDPNFMRPEYRVGAQFLNVHLPNANALTQGLASDRQASIFGTDPVGYVRDTVSSQQSEASFPGVPSLSSLGDVGKAIAASIVGLLVIALGLWVVVKQ